MIQTPSEPALIANPGRSFTRALRREELPWPAKYEKSRLASGRVTQRLAYSGRRQLGGQDAVDVVEKAFHLILG